MKNMKCKCCNEKLSLFDFLSGIFLKGSSNIIVCKYCGKQIISNREYLNLAIFIAIGVLSEYIIFKLIKAFLINNTIYAGLMTMFIFLLYLFCLIVYFYLYKVNCVKDAQN
ncbi:hypothetical protein [Sulfurimonas sp.]|uniref:hypothetical protein n=1 Tax=Sulfurimonas sp. TaxID=2022749 RepID=UPI003D0F29D0